MIKNLALLGVGEVHIFDLDNIEEHNLTRSVLFRPSDIGESKATVAAKRAMDLDPNITAIPYHGDFWTLLSLSDLRSFDVLFCCVDNFEARIRCNTLCYLAGVDFVNTGIDSRSAVVELYPFSQSRHGGCLECNMPLSVYHRIAQRYSCGYLRKVSFIERKIPTTIITSSAVASLAVSRGLRFGEAGDQAAPRRFCRRSTDHWIDPSRGERNHPRPHSTEARGIWLSSVELGPVRVDVGKTPVNRPTDRSAWRIGCSSSRKSRDT